MIIEYIIIGGSILYIISINYKLKHIQDMIETLELKLLGYSTIEKEEGLTEEDVKSISDQLRGNRNGKKK